MPPGHLDSIEAEKERSMIAGKLQKRSSKYSILKKENRDLKTKLRETRDALESAQQSNVSLNEQLKKATDSL